MRIALAALAALAFVPATALGTSSTLVQLTATMNGGKEVPKGDPTATGRAELKLNTKTGRVCWVFTLTGVKGPSAAHIHKGNAGVAGGVVVPLGTAFKRSGCTAGDPAVVRAIVAHPNAYYVNVHTAKYPAGAVRGQLARKKTASSGGYGY